MSQHTCSGDVDVHVHVHVHVEVTQAKLWTAASGTSLGGTVVRAVAHVLIGMAPKRKQSKTNWRKRGQEFEEATLTARQSRDLDVRTGGSFSGKADADLFSVTAGGSSAATAPRARRREERSTTPLYVDRNVAANPHVPIVSKVRTPGAEKLTRHSMKVRKVQERAVRQNAHTRPKPRVAAPAVYDLWGDASAPAQALSTRSPRAVAKARTTRRSGSEVPETKGGAGALPAVQVPMAGASYNPSREAHQELLGHAVGYELERIRKSELHQQGAFGQAQLRAVEDEGVGTNRDDAEAKGEGEGEGEGEDEAGEGGVHRERDKLTCATPASTPPCAASAPSPLLPSPLPPLRPDPAVPFPRGALPLPPSHDRPSRARRSPRSHTDLTPISPRPRAGRLAKRKRLKRARDLEAEQQAEAAERKSAKQLGRVGALISELVSGEKKLAKRQKAEKETEEKRPRRMGKLKYDPGREGVLLTEELPANLRSLPAVPPREGLMNDRYKSLQARNLIEPRKMAGKNKTRKMNSVTKNSAKDLKYTSPHSKWNTSKDTKYTSGMELPSWM